MDLNDSAEETIAALLKKYHAPAKPEKPKHSRCSSLPDRYVSDDYCQGVRELNALMTNPDYFVSILDNLLRQFPSGGRRLESVQLMLNDLSLENKYRLMQTQKALV